MSGFGVFLEHLRLSVVSFGLLVDQKEQFEDKCLDLTQILQNKQCILEQIIH